MSLKKCKECKQEISTDVKVCPNCGSKKPFKGIELTRNETKAMSFKERAAFEKAGGSVTKGTFEKIGNVFLIVFIMMIIYAVISPKSEKSKKQEIEKIEQTIKNIPFEKIEENRNGYKKLSEYYPNNKKYKEKYDFYQSRYNLMADCQYLAKQNNKLSLNNQSTYNENWDFINMSWQGTDKYKFESSFSGKNSFGVEQKFVAKYMCHYNKGKILIERVYIKKY